MLHRKTEILNIERESVIVTAKPKLVQGLLDLIEEESDRHEFSTLCKRIESTIRAWYNLQFEDLMQLYSLFDPMHGPKRLEQLKLSVEEVDKLEQRFLQILFQLMSKSNFKILTDDEVEVATSGEYLLNMPIAVDKSKLDKKLFTTFFSQGHFAEVPSFATQYVIFRRGIGIDRTTDYFIMSKLDLLISRAWNWLLQKLRLQKLPEEHHHVVSKTLSRKLSIVESDFGVQPEDTHQKTQDENLHIERICIQNMDISFKNLFHENTVQEPTFDRIILVYRKASKPHPINSPLGDRAIYVKHFRNIPMADMELVLPEKKNPGLTPMDWVKLLISAVVGLVALVGSLEVGNADVWVALAILGGIIGYIAKIYFTFQANLAQYQNLITKSMYDKQLDSGRGTLLHLCDDVIQQEVKEVILAYFILMTQGKATEEDLDRRCEHLLATKFNEKCDFEVDDAISKLEKLEIVSKDSEGMYTDESLTHANDIIGVTTDELVEKTFVKSK